MITLVALVSTVLLLWSLTWPVSAVTHIIVILVLALPVWYRHVSWRPYVPCPYCDKGRTWDHQHEHFGLWCPGKAAGAGSCHGAGKKLRWEVKALQLVGFMSALPDPVATAQSRDHD